MYNTCVMRLKERELIDQQQTLYILQRNGCSHRALWTRVLDPNQII